MSATADGPADGGGAGGGLSLRSRIAVGSAVLVALPILAALAAVLLVGNSVARDAVADSLSRSQAVLAHFRERRAQELALISSSFSSDPAFRGYVAEAVRGGLGDRDAAAPGDGIDRRSIADLLDERRADLGFDFSIVLDDEGRVLVRGEGAELPGPTLGGAGLADDPLVAGALRELRPVTGIWLTPRGLHQAAVVPLAHDRELIGFLVTALALDDRWAAQLRRVAGIDVALVARPAGADGADVGGPVAFASSLDVPRREALVAELGRRGALWEESVGAGRTVESTPLELRGERVAARIDPLRDAAGEPIGASVAIVSVDRQLSAFRRIQRVVLLVGVVGLLLAVAASIGFARRTLRPVRALAAAAEAAAHGDYSRRIETPNDDEVGRTARAFNALLGELRERRAMRDYVKAIARHLPDPMSTGPAVGGPAPARPAGTGDATETLAAGEVAGAAAAPAGDGARDALAPGTRVADRYRILAPLGAGAMGVVYQARDDELRELVALKLLKTDRSERLKNEIKLARKITHPNVVRTFDYGEWDGMPFISMEYVRGLTLQYMLRETGRTPFAAALHLALQICDGLSAAHAVGIVHRDIKPGNLILETDGTAKLMDFGLAVPARPVEAGGTATFAGTPRYMPPEAFAGEEPGVAGDIYAVGVVLYEMVCGRPPFVERRLRALAEEKRRPAPPLDGAGPDVPPAFAAVVLRCLDVDPARRFPDVASLRAALDGFRR